MKKVTFIVGTVFLSMFFIALMFKLMHWPGAGVMYVISTLGFALVTVPTFASYLYRKNDRTSKEA